MSLLLATFATAIVLLLAARLFPVKGEAADRSICFLEKLGGSAAPTVDAENPAPIAGLVIGVMGVVLAVIAHGFTHQTEWADHWDWLGLLAIGLAMR